MKVGDLVRYRQGSLDRKGIIIRDCGDGDFVVAFVGGQHPSTDYGYGNKAKCRWRCLEVISESR